MRAERKSPDASDATSRRVVVGVHGSRSSLRALQHAADVARDRGWDLEIVTAWPDADDPMIHDVPGRYIAARGHAVDCQRRALATLDPPMEQSVETYLVNARPTQALVSRCGEADLLVVGAGRPDQERGRRGVGAECVEEAPCPVTVVPDAGTGPAQAATTPPPRRPGRRPSRGRKAGAGANA